MWNSFDSFGGYGMHAPFWFLWAPLLGLIFLGALALKGYALWHAARRGETWWFVALLVINTMGILEIIYIAAVLKKFSGGGHHKKEEHHHEHHNHTHHQDHSSSGN